MTCRGVMNGGGSPTTDSETVMVAAVGKSGGKVSIYVHYLV